MGPENGLVEDHDVSRDATQQTDQISQVGGRPYRLDVRVALEDVPQRLPDPVVAGRDDDRHGGPVKWDELDGHGKKDRREAGLAHPHARLNRAS